MGDHQYIVLLNEAVKAHLVGLSGSQKKRLREKFEFLENGLWDSGLRVKKLKGPSDRVVFEARLSASDRMLFTLGHHRGKTAIYVWGIARHEVVEAEARKILPGNAPFLHFEPFREETFPEIGFDELPPEYYTTEDVAEQSPEDYGPQKWLVLDPEEWRRILAAADPDGFELFLFLTPEQREVLQRDPPVLLAGTAGSGKTTIAVYYLLRGSVLDKKKLFLTYSPHLKRFSERIYDGLVVHAEGVRSGLRPDFFVFRDLLRAIVESHGGKVDDGKEVGLREFQEIFRLHRLSRKYDAELVWEEIRSIIKGAKSPVSPERLAKLVSAYDKGTLPRQGFPLLREQLLSLQGLEVMEKIHKAAVHKAGFGSYEEFVLCLEPGPGGSAGAPRGGPGACPAAGGRVNAVRPVPQDRLRFVLHEILRFLAKKGSAFEEPLLSLQEYVMLGRKRAPNFVCDRREIYEIASFYQERLEAQGLWDEVDLCKRALQILSPASERFLYDLAVCDEVQDFSDVQLALLFRLVRDGRSVFLAGDAKQIINPSGFRWEEVKNKFYERGMEVPEVVRLGLNFRCAGGIVKLSNALLDLKRDLVGLSDTEVREEWKFGGKPPVLLYGLPEKEVLETLRLSGAGQIVVTRATSEQKKLKRALGTELVFTIFEAKGLEFDSVLVWKFFEDETSEEVWRKIRAGQSMLDPAHHAHVRHELSLLYVAATRARNTLVFYDGQEPGWTWTLDRFRDLLYRCSEKDALREVWQRVSTPAEWESQADYFFERQYYPAAAECYRNAGNVPKMEIAQAYLYEQEGRHEEAASLFERHGMAARAADNYEKAGDFGRARALWEAAGDRERARTCRILHYERSGEYASAAAEWEKLREFGKALENWARTGNHGKIAECHLALKDYGKAGDAFQKAGRHREAASCYLKAGKRLEAAECAFLAGDYKTAAALYRKLRKSERLLECALAMGDHYGAAQVYEKREDLDGAVEHFRKFAEISAENRKKLLDEARVLEARRRALAAAVRYSALSLYERSAPLYVQRKRYGRAIREYEMLGDFANLAILYEKEEKFYEAALALEKTQSEDRREEVARLLSLYLASAWSSRTSDRKGARGRLEEEPPSLRLRREARECLDAGDVEAALARFEALEDWGEAGKCFLAQGRLEEGILCFVENRAFASALEFWRQSGGFDVSREFLGKVAERLPPQQLWNKWPIGDDPGLALMAELVLRRLAISAEEETCRIADLIVSRGFDVFSIEKTSDPILELALVRRNYKSLFLGIRFYRPEVAPSERVKAFLERIRTTAERENDPNLMACYWCAVDPTKVEELLESLPLTRENVDLFFESRKQYRRAVDLLVGDGRLEEAARVCARHGDHARRGAILEKAGQFKEAAKAFLCCQAYEDGLRCARKANDLAGVARIYEKMGHYGKALDLWSRLGRRRDVDRVRAKMGPDEQESLKFK